MQKHLTDFELERVKAFEKIPTDIVENSTEGSLAVAREIASLIRKKEQENKPCVLGLATGNTPKLVYTELIRLHREENLSFRTVYTFNLDESYPIDPDSPQSYFPFMKNKFLENVNNP